MLNKWITFEVSAERRDTVFQEISDGSTPAPRFYFMVVASNMIAVLGLVGNSAAVIIGAMLVAPLMTPIFGISLSLIRGNHRLLGRAIRAELVGVFLCILLGFAFGLIPLSMDLTPVMLTRTQPNLLDLLVAIFAGLAGSYAMVDERISPSLPGVAIATAIVPPLANSGLCFALGETASGFGSFILFLANFFSILVAASIVFAATGMGSYSKTLSRRDLARRFGVAVFSLICITVIFTYSLVKLVNKRYIRQSIKYELVQALEDIPGTYLREFVWEKSSGRIHVLATVRTPSIIKPGSVVRIQNRISKSLKENIRLVIRNTLVKDIGATGSIIHISTKSKNEKAFDKEEAEEGFVGDERMPAKQKTSLAEQVLWEHFSRWPGFFVQNIEYHEYEAGDFIFASVQTPYPFDRKELSIVEKNIRKRLKDPDITLVISRLKRIITAAKGPLLVEWHNFEDWTEEKEELSEAIEEAIRHEMAGFSDVFFHRCHLRYAKDQWKALLETSGLRPLQPRELEQIRSRVVDKYNQPLEVYAWFRFETVVTPDGYSSYEDFIKEPMDHNKAQWKNED